MRATLLVLAGIAAAAFGAIAVPAVASAESADLTIATLEAQGFEVKVNKIGSATLDECVITDIRKPKERTEFVRRGNDRIQVVTERSITVTADCSRR
ncbi:hypothetical protein [Mycolicibacterium sp. XJ879]